MDRLRHILYNRLRLTRRFGGCSIAPILAYLALVLVTSSGCVHEFPDLPDRVTFKLKLNFSTDMPQWEYPIPSVSSSTRTEVPSKTVQTSGEMRYIVRLYKRDASAPATRAVRATDPYQEFTFTRNIADGGYDAVFDIETYSGDYSVLVWADLVENPGDRRYYDAADFSQIKLEKPHSGNNDYRDAFRGLTDVEFVAEAVEHDAPTVEVEMVRPLAKYEFVSTDLPEFISQEVYAAVSRGEISQTDLATDGNDPSRLVDIESYGVKFYYIGFMPNTFSMMTDKPVDSATGIVFDSKIRLLNDSEASIGFDYVFVNGTKATVSVQIAIFNTDGEQISLTSPIDVPLIRSKHTLMKGEFLMQKATGGVGIDPSFNGDHNIVIP